ncbi:hypothetical protein SDC9_165829 [bioreactor metagenome]|uniref:Uncharacterized protein n=1 Tax=bioreactor metagenome TaxID=1076179 RepID=A0A645FXW6_9ZZZZ
MQNNPGRVRRQRRPLIAQPHRAQPQNIGQSVQIAQIVSKAQSVITAVGFVVEREFRIAPVEVAGVDHRAADAGAVPPDPFGKRVDHDVSTVFDRAQQRRRSKGRVHDQRDVMLLRKFRIPLDIGDFQCGIADGFDIERTGFRIDRRCRRRKVVDRREAHRDALLRQNRVELGVGAAVKVAGGNDFIPLPGDVGQTEIDRRRAAGESQRRLPAVKRGQTLFQHVVGRVHQPGVDVAGFLERE